ncbi:hypothetical protein [Dyella sp.]|jgi:hypothetical protein|uniref:hypothetical protein n=1 Tax=Dyella sp. TaxID=1869338 RepID=UPI002FDB417A
MSKAVKVSAHRVGCIADWNSVCAHLAEHARNSREGGWVAVRAEAISAEKSAL